MCKHVTQGIVLLDFFFFVVVEIMKYPRVIPAV